MVHQKFRAAKLFKEIKMGEDIVKDVIDDILELVVFRAENIGYALQYIQDMFIGLVTKSGYIETLNLIYWKIGFAIPALLATFILTEWFGRANEYAIQSIGLKLKSPLRYAFYYGIVIAILWFGGREQQFIYFQF